MKFLKSFKLNMNTPEFGKHIFELAGCGKSGGTLQTPQSFTIRLRDPSAPLLDPPLWKIPLPEMRILQGVTSGNPPPPLKRSEIRVHAVDCLPRVHRTTVSKTLRITFEGPCGHAACLLPCHLLVLCYELSITLCGTLSAVGLRAEPPTPHRLRTRTHLRLPREQPAWISLGTRHVPTRFRTAIYICFVLVNKPGLHSQTEAKICGNN